MVSTQFFRDRFKRKKDCVKNKPGHMGTDKNKRTPSRERVAKKTLDIGEKGIIILFKIYKYLPKIQYFNINDTFTF